MKVLVLGLPRTGTQSIADALHHLGVTPIYHMRHVAENSHQDLWLQAMRAKFESSGEPKPWGRSDFDQILASFQGVADYPAAIFVDELAAAYPEAAIILSTRPVDSWVKSMDATLVHHHQRTLELDGDFSPLADLRRAYHRHCWDDDFQKNGRGVFARHNAAVRAAGRGRPFLEVEVASGWQPLCDFLGVAVPNVPFPRKDDWAQYKKEVEAEEVKLKEDAPSQ